MHGNYLMWQFNVASFVTICINVNTYFLQNLRKSTTEISGLEGADCLLYPPILLQANNETSVCMSASQQWGIMSRSFRLEISRYACQGSMHMRFIVRYRTL